MTWETAHVRVRRGRMRATKVIVNDHGTEARCALTDQENPPPSGTANGVAAASG